MFLAYKYSGAFAVTGSFNELSGPNNAEAPIRSFCLSAAGSCGGDSNETATSAFPNSSSQKTLLRIIHSRPPLYNLLFAPSMMLLIATKHISFRKVKANLLAFGHDFSAYRHAFLPFSYAVVSGAIGSWSVLFGKSL